MRQFKFWIFGFLTLIAMPIAYIILTTYQGIHQEEIAELKFFADTLFNEIETDLENFLITEQARPYEHYTDLSLSTDSRINSSNKKKVPPFLNAPYIIGYLQNNPNGSYFFSDTKTPINDKNTLKKIDEINRQFNTKRALPSQSKSAQIKPKLSPKPQKLNLQFADRYISRSKSKIQKKILGQQKKRIEEITQTQAMNFSKNSSRNPQIQMESEISNKQLTEANNTNTSLFNLKHAEKFQIEVDPMQSVFIDKNTVFIYRRIAIQNKIYRQGVLIKIHLFLDYLLETYFLNQPLAKFTKLDLTLVSKQTQINQTEAKLHLDHQFPRPFSFISANLYCDAIPPSVERITLNRVLLFLFLIIGIGLIAIYKSIQTVFELSEKKTQFVSTITHELKTPLTNIRLYTEMLEQGIAESPEKELEYFRILSSESYRLSRLINNVLEYAQLEKKQRCFNHVEGNFEDVLEKVEEITKPNIIKENFQLMIDKQEIPPFKYDKEVMVQVLINLIENSIKFGREAREKRICLKVRSKQEKIEISVIDHGPGIPKNEITHIFKDFYRADNAQTRSIPGTGIGLALVKRFIKGVNGTVRASNNKDSGCTITINLPL